MTPHESPLARIVAGMELVARGLPRPGLYDNPVTPVADEVQRMADDLAETTAYAAELTEELESIREMVTEALPPGAKTWKETGVLVRQLCCVREAEGKIPETDELMVGWTSDL